MIKRFLRSFGWACQGIATSWQQERHLKLHSVAAIVVVVLGIWLELNHWEWAAMLICIGMVFATEMINAAIERLADVVQPERDDRIKVIKNISAGAVLVMALISAGIGLSIFLPRILRLF